MAFARGCSAMVCWYWRWFYRRVRKSVTGFIPLNNQRVIIKIMSLINIRKISGISRCLNYFKQIQLTDELSSAIKSPSWTVTARCTIRNHCIGTAMFNVSRHGIYGIYEWGDIWNSNANMWYDYQAMMTTRAALSDVGMSACQSCVLAGHNSTIFGWWISGVRQDMATQTCCERRASNSLRTRY